MRSDTPRNVGLVGAVAAAVVASACCIGPLAFALLRLGGAGLLVSMAPYRPLFTVITLGLLGVGYYTTYASPPVADDDCGCEMPTTHLLGRWTLWAATAVALLTLLSPTLIPYLF